MDRNTAAALGQNLSSAFADIGQIFDPRVRAAADQQRLTNEGLTLRNTGQGIENQYAPQVFGSQIGLNNAKTATEGTQQGLYKSQTAFQNTRNQGLGDLYKLNSQSQTNLTPLQQKIASAATTYNVDPNVALSIIGQESNFNPNTTPGTSSASGLFQFLDADRAKYGIGSDAPEDQQIDAGMRKMQANYNAAEKALGRKPTAGEAYAVYYQGIGAGPKILQNPDASFRDTLSQFGPGYADSVIKANPWLADIKTNRDFINWSEQKMGKQGFTGQPQPVDMNRAAILSSVAGGGGDPQQLINAFNAVRASNTIFDPSATPDQIRIGQAGMGVANPQFNTVAGTTDEAIRAGAPALRSDEMIASGNAQSKLIGNIFGGSTTRRGDGSMLGVPKTAPDSYTEATKARDAARQAGYQVFDVPLNEEGQPEEDPYANDRRAWTESVSNLILGGRSEEAAIAEANLHHFGTQSPEIRSYDPLGFGDKIPPVIKNPNPIPQSQVLGATQNPEDVASIIQQIPSLFGMQVQAPGIANTGAPVTGVEQPAQPTQNTPPPAARPERMNRASDQFKPREGSAEKKARLGKEKEIATLEADINETLDTLRTGSVRTSGVGMMRGGMSGAFTPPSELVSISDDAYNSTLNRLKEMEKRLEKPRGGSNQSGQGKQVGRFLVE